MMLATVFHSPGSPDPRKNSRACATLELGDEQLSVYWLLAILLQ